MTDRGDNAVPLKAPSLVMGGLHLAALWALAIVQPLLNLLGNNPDFFVARDNTALQIVVFAILLVVLPPFVATLVEALASLASTTARVVLHLLLCGALFSAIALQVLKSIGDGPAWPMILVAIALGALLTWAYANVRFVRSMADILVVAPPVILVSFLFFSDASELTISTPEVQAREVTATRPAPVVMVVFDEFPAGSLMTPSGQINPKRFPHFAELKRSSTWYRNTATDASYTAIAVPSILTGQEAERDSLPTAADHPDSIFTLLGREWKTRAIEPITQLCTEEICGERDGAERSLGGALASLTDDLTAVSAHLLLPEEMGSSLPDISQTFQGFGGAPEGESIERGRARQFVRDRLDTERENSIDAEADVESFIGHLGRRGRTFDFVHVEEPHYPWTHYPTGLAYADGTEDFRGFFDESTWFAPPYVTDRAHQAHQLEVGFADDLLGRIMDAVKARGNWEETLFVVTADHGAAWTPDRHRREATPETMGQIGLVPLFIKAPGQGTGRIVNRPTCTTEIVPEMARILGVDLPWEAGECDREVLRLDNGTGPLVELLFAEALAQRRRYVDEMARLLGGDGTPWERAFRWGRHKDLIGRPVSSLGPVAPPAEVTAAPIDRFDTFAPAGAYNPVLRQRGTVEGVGEGTSLAVAVNGTVAAVGQTYAEGDSIRYSFLLPQSRLRNGFNAIAVYAVEPAGQGSGVPRLSGPLWTSIDQ